LACSSSIQTVAGESLGARQSLRGDSEPPEPTFGTVRHRRALELAALEEALQEHLEPSADRREVVFATLVLGHGVRPRSALAVAPRGGRKEGDLARPITEAAHVVQVEVLQVVRADDGFG
jgi:hypothetical protein